MLGAAGGIDTTEEYTKAELVVMGATAQAIADSESNLLVELYCNSGFGDAFAVYVDDITITTF